MNELFYFKNDGNCKWMNSEIENSFPKYLHEPVEFQGKPVKFYLILNWISSRKRGANPTFLDEQGVNYVKTIYDLPEGAGIYTTGYDADLVELEIVKKKGIPVIESPCPWIKKIKQQLLEVDTATHQCVFMIDHGHIVYDCYQSIFPDGTIVINPETFKDEIDRKRNGKPLYLIVYAVFRKKDAERVVNFIDQNYNHPDNILNGYQQTLCRWTRQGLLEELEETITGRGLDEVWIICNSEVDRSTKSIIQEVKENGSMPVIIKTESDIPEDSVCDKKIGVVIAPIPLTNKAKNIINIIKNRYSIDHEF